MKKVNNQKGFIAILLAIVILIGLGGGVYLYSKQKGEVKVEDVPAVMDTEKNTENQNLVVATTSVKGKGKIATSSAKRISGATSTLKVPHSNGDEDSDVQNVTNKLRECPTSKVDNQMPTMVPNNNPPSTYFIFNGERHELTEFDLEWVSKNCTVKTQTVN